jgi:hypothetical protein
MSGRVSKQSGNGGEEETPAFDKNGYLDFQRITKFEHSFMVVIDLLYINHL